MAFLLDPYRIHSFLPIKFSFQSHLFTLFHSWAKPLLPSFTKFQQNPPGGLMERCVISHTLDIVPSFQLPSMEDSEPGRAAWPDHCGNRSQPPCSDSLSYYSSPWGRGSLQLTLFSVPSEQRPLYKAPKAKRSEIDSLWTAMPGRAQDSMKGEVPSSLPLVPTLDT